MADTSLSAQIEHDYKVSKWSRNTVADGSWLQKYTVEKLTNRDIFLANAIDTLNSGTDEDLSSLSAAISYVSATHDEYIDYLSATLSGTIYDVSALNEKVSSFSSEYKTFVSATNERFNNIESNADGLQNQIDTLKAATDVISVFGTYPEFTAASASTWQQQVTDNDFIKVLRDSAYNPTGDEDANTTDEDYYQVYYQWHSSAHDGWNGWSAIGNLDPYYSVREIDDYLDQINNEFDNLSATVADNYLSANENAVSAGKNIKIDYEQNKPKITINTKEDVEFNNVSSKNVSSTNVTALTAQGNSAKFTNLSATNLNNVAINNLFNSAQSGAKASAYITAHSGDFLNSAHSAYGTLTFGTKAYPATNSNYNFTFLAGQGIGFTTANNQVTISAEGTTYQAGDYISTANKEISVTGKLIGSAQSGKSAYNILSGTKISAVGSQFTNTAFGYLSAGFRISAGDNLIISTGANNTFNLNAKPSIDTTFSNIWYEGGAEPLGETGTITGITAKFNNDFDSHNHIVNQSVVFGTSGNEVISGLLIQPADPTEDGNVLTYNSLNNSYTWQPGGTTYTTANENIVINNGLKTIGLASSVSSNDLHLTGTNGVVISLNCNYISGYYAGSTTDFTAKMNWRDLLTLNYVSSCNKLGSDGLPVIRVSACSQIPSISEMVEGIYYLV